MSRVKELRKWSIIVDTILKQKYLYFWVVIGVCMHTFVPAELNFKRLLPLAKKSSVSNLGLKRILMQISAFKYQDCLYQLAAADTQFGSIQS